MISLRNVGLAFIGSLFLYGCDTIPKANLTEFSDFRSFVLLRPLTYRIGDTQKTITVPAGFVTDLASIPQYFWSYVSPMGKYSKAAIIHDYLYWTHKCNQEQADKIFLIAMKESGVTDFKRYLLYEAVHLAGEGAWEANKKDKEKGYIKIIPPEWLDFSDEITWQDYREILYKKNVKETISEEDTSYCECGNSVDVPKATDGASPREPDKKQNSKQEPKQDPDKDTKLDPKQDAKPVPNPGQQTNQKPKTKSKPKAKTKSGTALLSGGAASKPADTGMVEFCTKCHIFTRLH